MKLLLGVDGGGSKTTARVAELDGAGKLSLLGESRTGPSNLRLSGKDLALSNLDAAVDGALHAAGRGGRRIDYGVLALAGSTDPDVRAALLHWADRSATLGRVRIMHDAEPVLLGGTAEGWGVALLVGTGSVAWARSASGATLVRGGWGHWFGDQGSGYDLGRKALTAAAAMDDGHGAETVLLERILHHFELDSLRQLMKILAGSDTVQRQIASCAPAVIAAAEQGDAVALDILAGGVTEVCRMAHAAAAGLDLPDGYPLALAGSVIGRNPIYLEQVCEQLQAFSPRPGPVSRVEDPALACLEIARKELMVKS